jgi:hypothetical protein
MFSFSLKKNSLFLLAVIGKAMAKEKETETQVDDATTIKATTIKATTIKYPPDCVAVEKLLKSIKDYKKPNKEDEEKQIEKGGENSLCCLQKSVTCLKGKNPKVIELDLQNKEIKTIPESIESLRNLMRL